MRSKSKGYVSRKAKGRSLGFLRFGLGFDLSYDADKYSLQFAGFFSYHGQSVFRKKSAFAEQFQPVLSFLQLLQRPFNFTNEIGVGFGSCGLAVLRSHRCPSPEQLAAQYLSLGAFRQCGKEPDNRKSILFCSDLEIAVGHGCRISSFILQPLSFQARLPLETPQSSSRF